MNFQMDMTEILGILSTIGSLLIAIAILLVMITIHEFGHYIAGKILKFKIKEFSIGMGPALFTRVNQKTGEKFSLRLVPLGGYCAFEDELASGAMDSYGKTKPTMEEEVFLDEKVTDLKKIKDEAPMSEVTPPKGSKSLKNDGKFYSMSPWKRIIVLVSGPLMNYVLGFLCIVIGFMAFGQIQVGAYKVTPTDDIAAEYCLRDNDVFLKVEGKDVYSSLDLMEILKDRQAGEKVKFTISRVVETKEDGTHVREIRDVEVQLRGATNFENSADADKLWHALGLAIGENAQGEKVYMAAGYLYKLSFSDAIARGGVYSLKLARSIFTALGELLTGRLGAENMGGPLSTITLTTQVIRRGGASALEIAAYIGVNLAVFNLLPIPALDGSKIIFTLIEWVRGKPIDRTLEGMIHTIGMLLLFAFAIGIDLLHVI